MPCPNRRSASSSARRAPTASPTSRPNGSPNIAKARGDFEVEIVDLRDFPLPFFDEVGSSALGAVARTRWRSAGRRRSPSFDGFIFTAAEYNRGPTGGAEERARLRLYGVEPQAGRPSSAMAASAARARSSSCACMRSSCRWRRSAMPSTSSGPTIVAGAAAGRRSSRSSSISTRPRRHARRARLVGEGAQGRARAGRGRQGEGRLSLTCPKNQNRSGGDAALFDSCRCRPDEAAKIAGRRIRGMSPSARQDVDFVGAWPRNMSVAYLPHRAARAPGRRVASTLSMRRPSRSTTSKRQPCASTHSPVAGRWCSSDRI